MGQNLSAYRFYRVTLTPGQILNIASYARFITILSNTISTNVKMSINGDSFEELPSGLSVELPPEENFEFLNIQNTHATDNMTIEFSLSAGRIMDNRLVISGSTFTDILNELKGDSTPENWGADVSVGNAATVELLNVNTSRKSALIQSDITNTGIIYIGFDNSVSATKKICALLPGGVYSVDDYQGDLWAIASVAAQKVSASEV